MQAEPGGCCNRSPSPKEIGLGEAGYNDVEDAILEISRYFFQTFAIPEAQSWLTGMQRAESRFAGAAGPGIAFDILAAVQAMRMSRVSPFRFNNPSCPGCSAIVSEHERQFVGVYRAVRRGHRGEAQMHALLLCEGNATACLMRRMEALVASTKPYVQATLSNPEAQRVD